MESIGRINCYACEVCGSLHGTINVNTGVTPFLIACRVEGCDGMAVSQCYRKAMASAGWAWYRPTPEAFLMLEPEEQEHVLHGGLLIEELGQQVAMLESDEDYEQLTHDDFDVVRAYLENTYGRKSTR
jgi:hypothetical protein